MEHNSTVMSPVLLNNLLLGLQTHFYCPQQSDGNFSLITSFKTALVTTQASRNSECAHKKIRKA